LIIGDVILDEYVTGDAHRLSPEAPIPVVEFRTRSRRPGGAANVATNIAALGCRVDLFGVVGMDEEARHLRTILEMAGVYPISLLCDPERPTTVKLRIVAQNQQIVRLDHEVRTAITSSLENVLLEQMTKSLTDADACILSDYGKGVVTPRIVQQTISACRAAGVPVLVDPKSLDLHWCLGATLVKPNKHEAERLANREIHDDASFFEVGSHLASLLEGTGILITRGSLGMSLFRHQMEPFHMRAMARNVYDVTGAGDTVISMYGMALAAGASPEESVWLASQAAAVAVEKAGTTTVSASELWDRCNKS
jgi:D-beta-D-heptose 7-phosphate kinase/D-beta-D-heptose 1-phosphate adenosyltransferase